MGRRGGVGVEKIRRGGGEGGGGQEGGWYRGGRKLNNKRSPSLVKSPKKPSPSSCRQLHINRTPRGMRPPRFIRPTLCITISFRNLCHIDSIRSVHRGKRNGDRLSSNTQPVLLSKRERETCVPVCPAAQFFSPRPSKERKKKNRILRVPPFQRAARLKGNYLAHVARVEAEGN